MNEKKAPKRPEEEVRSRAENSTERVIGAEELITRLAEQMRAKGDPELPLSFYEQQVRHALAHGFKPQSLELSETGPIEACNDATYQSWALNKG